MFIKSILSAALLAGIGGQALADAELVKDGNPAAIIVLSAKPSPAAKLGAMELQYWVKKISGAELPIVSGQDGNPAVTKIFVGEQGLPSCKTLNGLEYEVTVKPREIILRGVDKATATGPTYDFGAMNSEANNGLKVTLPGKFELQGTLKAVYDFIEDQLGVRFYGPKAVSITYPKNKNISVKETSVIREPSFKLFDGSYSFSYPLVGGIYGMPNNAEADLFLRRVRFGGIPWYNNHTMYAYQKRFGKILNDPLFESDHPEFFPPEGAKAHQLCYSSDALAEQVAKDAIAYFSGKMVPGLDLPPGSDYFPVVSTDSSQYCSCSKCQEVLKKDARKAAFVDGMPLFSGGQASNYWFAFINKVAKKVKDACPGKYIATLAYDQYYWTPDFPLEDNVSVAPCIAPRLAMCHEYSANEVKWLKKWIEYRDAKKCGPLFLWNYYCFPEELVVTNNGYCFPGFMAGYTGRIMQDFAADGVQGIFFCGIGEQLDFYVIRRAMNNVNFDTKAIINEFFGKYFGNAAAPMRKFYDTIEGRFFNPELYKAKNIEGHQSQKIAWEILATPEVMADLKSSIEAAQAAADTPETKARVAIWKTAVYDYMCKGYNGYLERVTKLKATPKHSSLAPGYIANIDADASWQYDVSSYSLTTGKNMIEAEPGVLGTKNAKILVKSDAVRPWNGLARNGTWVEFDLGAVYDLNEIRIWNYQQNCDLVERGMRQISITAAPTADASTRREIYSGILPMGEKKVAFGPSLALPVKDLKARFIRITSIGEYGVGNWGNRTYSSLGQVRFYGTPVK